VLSSKANFFSKNYRDRRDRRLISVRRPSFRISTSLDAALAAALAAATSDDFGAESAFLDPPFCPGISYGSPCTLPRLKILYNKYIDPNEKKIIATIRRISSAFIFIIRDSPDYFNNK
jgi:hypothetical protein